MLDAGESVGSASVAGAVRVTMLTKQSVVRVQTWMPEQAADDFLATAARHGWPIAVGGVADGEARKLCVGPADWLVMATTMDVAALRERLVTELPAQGCVAVDLTQALAIIGIAGEQARAILSSGCGLDLHPAHFGAGQCARVRLANVPVVIDCRGQHEFELYGARSYLSYLRAWLADAAEGLAG